ncbi:MAG: hypothetical protein PHY29_03070 [Syntrophales bacterium]|nr:hypothetical protein [Syntrophales bacterium]
MADNPWGQISQAFSNITANAANMAEMQKNGRLMRQQEQLNQININKSMMEFKQIEEKEKMLNSPWDATTDPLLAGLPDNKRVQYLNSLKKIGVVNQQGIGTQRNRAMVIERMKADVGLASDYANIRLEQSRQSVGDAYEALQKAQQGGDEQKIAQAQQTYKTAVEKNNILAGKVDSGLKKVQINEFFRKNKALIDELTMNNPTLQLLLQQARATDDPAQVQTILMKAVEARQKAMEPVKLGQGEVLVSPGTGGGQPTVIARGEPKPESLQLIGHTPDNQPVNYNPRTGQQEVGGRPYTGRVIPKVEKVVNTSPREMGKDAASLRKEFNSLQEVRDYNNIKTKYNAMVAALGESKTSENMVAVDQALITLFNKMTDPNSVVRESEYARTGVNMPFINMVKGKAQKIMEGGAGLTPEERNAIVRMGKLFMATYQNNYNSRMQEYANYATMSGINPNMVFSSKQAGKTGTEQPKQTYSKADLEFTAKKYGMTVDQVKAKLGIK